MNNYGAALRMCAATAATALILCFFAAFSGSGELCAPRRESAPLPELLGYAEAAGMMMSAAARELTPTEPPVYEPEQPSLPEGAVFDKGIFDAEKYGGAVFYIPHQDDETLFFAPAIISAVNAFGAEHVYVVLFTDGAASYAGVGGEVSDELDRFLLEVCNRLTARGRSDLSPDAAKMTETKTLLFSLARNNEFYAALGCLGVPEENISPLWLPDSELAAHDYKIASMMLSFARAEKLLHFTYSPYFDDHEDHRALGRELTRLASGEYAKLFEGSWFVVKSDGGFDDEFVSYSDGRAFAENGMRRSYDYALESILAASGQYCTADRDSLPAAAAQLVSIMVNQELSLYNAVMVGKVGSQLRLAVGQNSVPEMFEGLNAELAFGSVSITLHKAFDIGDYPAGVASHTDATTSNGRG